MGGGEKPRHTSRHYLYSAFADEAKRRRVRVLLDGVGGELGPSFHGDGYYPELLLSGKWWLLVKELRRRAIVDERSLWQTLKGHLIRPLLPISVLRLVGHGDRRYDIAQACVCPLLRPKFVERVLGPEVDEIAAAVGDLERKPRHHRYGQLRAILLTRTPPAMGFAGYEGVSRSLPFADKRIIEFCLAAPGRVKVHNGYKRYLIRAALDGVLPREIQWRTSKEPFSPDYHLRYNRQRQHVLDILSTISANDPIRDIVDVDTLGQLASVDMQGNRGDTPADYAAMHWVPWGIYLIFFLRQFDTL